MVSQTHAKLHRLNSSSDHLNDTTIPDANSTYTLGNATPINWDFVYCNDLDVTSDILWGGNLVRGAAAYYQIQPLEYLLFDDSTGTNWLTIAGVGAVGYDYVFIGGTQPDMPRNVVVGHNDVAAPHDIRIRGIGAQGQVVDETQTVVCLAPTDFNNAFSHISLVDVGPPANPLTVTIDAGNKMGVANNFIVGTDIYKTSKNTVDFALAGLTINITYDTVEETGVNIAATDEWHIWYKI